MRKVSLEGIGTPTPSGSSITDAYVEYKGLRVDEVPEGERFDIYATGTGRNPGAISWEVLITVTDDDGVAAYDTSDAYGDPYNTPRMKLDSLPPGYSLPRMPDHDITLRLKLWGNDTRGQPIPPMSEW